jgi:uncharacterized glyoxalase superfamily protein PhnB
MPHVVPDGYHTVTPYLVVRGVAQMVEFLQQAFDAVVTEQIAGPDGAPMHASLRIGDSMVMMGEAGDRAAPTSAMLYVYVADVDASYQRALRAGATAVREPEDQLYGDRSGGVRDIAGNEWWVATRKEEVSPEEIGRRMAARANG